MLLLGPCLASEQLRLLVELAVQKAQKEAEFLSFQGEKRICKTIVSALLEAGNAAKD